MKKKRFLIILLVLALLLQPLVTASAQVPGTDARVAAETLLAPVELAPETAYADLTSLRGTNVTLYAGETYQLPAVAGAVSWSSDNIGVAAVGRTGIVAGIGAGTATVTARNAAGDVLATFDITVEVWAYVNVALGKYVVSHSTGPAPNRPGAAPIADGILSEQNITNGLIIPRNLRGGAGNANDTTLAQVAGMMWWTANEARTGVRWLIVDLGDEYEIRAWDVVRAFAHNSDDDRWPGPGGFEVLVFTGDTDGKPTGQNQAELRAWWIANGNINLNATVSGANADWDIVGTEVDPITTPGNRLNINAECFAVSQRFAPVTGQYFMVRIFNPDFNGVRGGGTGNAQTRLNEFRLFAETDDPGNIDVVEWAVTGVETFPSRSVPHGTTFAALELPAEVNVTLVSGVVRADVMIPVVWDSAAYDPDVAGVNTITGALQLPAAGITNAGNIEVSVAVTVRPPRIMLYEGETYQLPAVTGAVTWTTNNLAVAAVGRTGLVAGISAGDVEITARNAAGIALQTFEITVDPSAGLVNVALGKYVVAYRDAVAPNLGGSTPTIAEGILSEQNITNGRIIPRNLRGAAGIANEGNLIEVAGSSWWSPNSPRTLARWMIVDLGDEYEIAAWDVVRMFAHNGNGTQWVGPAGFEVLVFRGDTDDKPAGQDQEALRAWWVANGNINTVAVESGVVPGYWALVGTVVEPADHVAARPANLDADLLMSQSFVPVTGQYFMLRIFMCDYNTVRGATGNAQARVNEFRLFAEGAGGVTWAVTGVEALPSRTVGQGTTFAALNLPAEVSVTLTVGAVTAEVMVPMVWDSTTYNPAVVGLHTITGALQLPGGITNAGNIEASVAVTVTPVDGPRYWEVSWDEIRAVLDEFVGVYADQPYPGHVRNQWPGVYTGPPQPGREFSDRQPDGHLMGNSTIFTFLHGTRDVQRLHFNHADLWERDRNEAGTGSQRTGYAPLGSMQISRTDNRGGDGVFRHELCMATAHVWGRSTRGFRTDNWISAVENVLMTYITNETAVDMDFEVIIVMPLSEQAPRSTTVSSSVDTAAGIMFNGKRSVANTASNRAMYNVNVPGVGNRLVVDFTMVTRLLADGDATNINMVQRTHADYAGTTLTFTLPPGGSVQMVSAIEGGPEARLNYHNTTSRARALDTLNRINNQADVEREVEAHQAWWRDYWLLGYILLDTSINTGPINDRMWQRLHLGELYRVGASIQARSRNPAYALQSGFPWTASRRVSGVGGQFEGNMFMRTGHVYGDTFRARYYMNTDIMRPAYSAVISNRLAHIDTYTRVIYDYHTTIGRSNARSTSWMNGVITHNPNIGRQHPNLPRNYPRPQFTAPLRGSKMHTNISPFAMDGFSHHNTASHGSMGLQPMVRYYNWTLDRDFLVYPLFPMVAEMADFWVDFAWWNPTYQRYEIFGATNEGRDGDGARPGAMLCQTAAEFILINAIRYSEYLEATGGHVDVCPVRRAEWQRVLTNMGPWATFSGWCPAGFSTIDANGVAHTVFSHDYITGLIDTRNNGSNSAPVQGLYMFDLISLDSPPWMLEYGRNFLDWVQLWGNDKAYRAGIFAARVAYPTQGRQPGRNNWGYLQALMTNLIARGAPGDIRDWDTMRNNNTTGDYGAAVLLSVINDSMLHSHDGTIRVFPSWDRDREITFRNLRGKGAFLVSGHQNASGVVEWVAIHSERGMPVYFVSEWENGAIVTLAECGTVVPTDISTTRYSGELLFRFETTPGVTYLLHERTEPIATATSVTITAEAEMSIGSSQVAIAEVLPAGLPTNAVSWSTSNPAVATVVGDGQGGGFIMTRGIGTVTIRATSLDDPTMYDEIVIAVLDVPATGIEITNAGSLGLDESRQLFTALTPTHTNQMGVTWTTSDSSVVAITAGGVITGLRFGSATIRAAVTENPAIYHELVITVRPDNNFGLEFNTTAPITLGANTMHNIVGYEFEILNPITITALGIFDSNGNGRFDNADTQVAIFTPHNPYAWDCDWQYGDPGEPIYEGGVMVASAVVRQGMPAHRGVIYAQLGTPAQLAEPVVLQPGRYVIATFYAPNAIDRWVHSTGRPFTTSPHVEYIEGIRMASGYTITDVHHLINGRVLGPADFPGLTHIWAPTHHGNFFNVNFQYVDKNELQAYVDKVEDLTQGTHDDALWAAFVEALHAAKAVLDDVWATQYDVTLALEALQDAHAALTGELPLRIRLCRSSLTIPRGQTEQLVATSPHTNIVWTTSDPAVALVGNDGTIVALSPGTATITATIYGTTVSASSLITVQPVGNVNVVFGLPAETFSSSVAVVAGSCLSHLGNGQRGPWNSAPTGVNLVNTPHGQFPVTITVTLENVYTIGRWNLLHASTAADISRDFALEYRCLINGTWNRIERIQDNTARETNRVLENPVTAQEFRIVMYDPDQHGFTWANWMVRLTEFELWTVDPGTVWDVEVVDAPAAVSVPVGTPAQDLSLPETVSVTLTGGVHVNVPVVWDTTGYVGGTIGHTYTFTGTLDLPAGIANTGDLGVSINVVVTVTLAPPNFTALDAAITAAGTHDEADYTAVSWSTLQTALTAAQAVRDQTDPYPTQQAVDDAVSALNAAITGLVPVPTAPTITTATLAGGRVGTAYSVTLAASGTQPITWTLESGTLPTGLTLSPTGVLSGTPTAAGTFTFTVRAENAADYDERTFTIVISPVDGGVTPQPPTYTYEYHDAFMFGNTAGEFRPRANTTRAEVAAILVRTMVEDFEEGEYPAGAAPSFSDVTPANWFYWYVVWAYAEGLVQGYTDGTFRPNNPITRQEYAAMVARTGEVLEAGELAFADAATIGGWALDYVYTAFDAGWMIGDTNNNFRPQENINRAEVATATNRILGRVDSNAALEAANLQNPDDVREFPDVYEDAWYFASVLAAANDHRNRVCNETAAILRKVILER